MLRFNKTAQQSEDRLDSPMVNISSASGQFDLLSLQYLALTVSTKMFVFLLMFFLVVGVVIAAISWYYSSITRHPVDV